MDIGKTIAKLRCDLELSQEKFANLLGVSRQTVQKWESGVSSPDMENLAGIANKFGISMDLLVLGRDKREMEELRGVKKIEPKYDNITGWDSYSDQFMIEYRQSVDEGLDLEGYENLFRSVCGMPKGAIKEKMANALFELSINAPMRENYTYNEPSELAAIQALRPNAAAVRGKLPADIEDRVRGAWIGRICGCLLGKPVEGWRTEVLVPFLKETGNYPLHRYLLTTDVTDERKERYLSEYKISLENRAYADRYDCAPVDDDTNYTVMAMRILEKFGRDFTPYDVSRMWLDAQVIRPYCTAERVAYRNFINGYVPPASAVYKNPYREYIGAQIRGDYFGYINPGDPQTAAEMAWRDASISHVKNGIYGEMFVAAMIAAAPVCSDLKEVVKAGMAQIPKTSRLYEALSDVLEWYECGVSEKKAFAKIHEQYDEHNGYDWCHTISNAMIVAVCLLYGEANYSKSICMAVEVGFDTDCNGATVGSVIGMFRGSGAIESQWTEPVHGALDTTIGGNTRYQIEDLVSTTMRHVKK